MAYPDLDLRLIEALQEDGRRSLRELGEILDVSASTVRNHLNDLLERGVITGFKPEVDYARLGWSLVAVIRIRARGDAIPRLVEGLAADTRLTHVYEITGEFDVMVIGRFRDEGEMNREIKRLLSMDGVVGTNTSVVLSVHKERGDVALTADGEEEEGEEEGGGRGG